MRTSQMQRGTHVWCDCCDAMQPALWDEGFTNDPEDEFHRLGVNCAVCAEFGANCGPVFGVRNEAYTGTRTMEKSVERRCEELGIPKDD